MTDSDLTSGLSTELDDHPAEFENRTPEKSIQLAESELAKKRTSSEASLSEKKHTKRGSLQIWFRAILSTPNAYSARGVFDIVKNAPEPHLTVGPYQSNFRFEALIQFVELSLSNIKEARTRTNNTKILLAIASQQSGSEFGQHLLGEAKKNRDLLLQRFPKEELDYFLSAQYIYLNMSRIGDDFKKGFRSFFLECLLDHCPADKFQEAKEFWKKYSIHEFSIGDVAGWFVHKLQQPLFFHFVEIDAINEGHNASNAIVSLCVNVYFRRRILLW
jgi:hypothetical protein